MNRKFVAALFLCVLSVRTVSSGAAFAGTPSAPPSKSQQAIDVMYSSTKFAADALQKAPAVLQVLAAGFILESARAQLSHLNDPSSPGTITGGLDLYGYCQSIGFANGSYTSVPGVETTGGAYTWYCVAATGSQTAINIQDACTAEYPGQATIAYPQDPNNSYSWVCIVPTAGTYTDPTTGTTVNSILTPNSAATLITAQGSEYLAVNNNGNAASAILTAHGTSMSYSLTTILNGVRTSANKSLTSAQNQAASAAARSLLKSDGFGGGF